MMCCFLFVLRGLATSLLMIHLKCAVVYYAILNSSSIKKPYLRTVEYAFFFFFFRILIYDCFNEDFIKNFLKKLSFLIQIFKIHFKMYISKCLKYELHEAKFEYEAKFENSSLLFRSEISIFDIFFKIIFKESFEDLQIRSN